MTGRLSAAVSALCVAAGVAAGAAGVWESKPYNTWTDAELKDVWDEMEAWRLDGQGRFVTMLADKGALRAGLSVEEARDVVWTLCSLAVHDLLVVERGWTSEHYQEWLTSVLTFELLPDAGA